MRKLRKGFAPQQGRLRDLRGNLVDSDTRAETLAEYYCKVQWAVRPTTLMNNSSALGPPLPVSMEPITEKEVVEAAKVLKSRKACGKDGIPG